MQILTISMQTGLRQIMDPEGATLVVSVTGIKLIDPLSHCQHCILVKFSDIMYIETVCYCIISIYEFKKIPAGVNFSLT